MRYLAFASFFIFLALNRAWADPSCHVHSEWVRLTRSETEAITDFYDFMTYTVGEEVPTPGLDRDRSPQARETAFEKSQIAMQAELGIFHRVNRISSTSAATLRVFKFPQVAASVQAGESDPDFYNPLPLSESSAWQTWSTEWQHHFGKMEVYLESPDGQKHLFKTLTVRELNGVPGPKTAAGDLQVPEGSYDIGEFFTGTDFFIAFPFLYNPQGIPGLGGEIEIHGSGVSVGCLDMGNLQIAQLSSLWPTTALVEPFRLDDGTLDVFLSKMTPATEQAWGTRLAANSDLSGYSDLSAFWKELRQEDIRFMSSVVPGVVSMDDLVQISCD